jgi:hypothetical protein
MTPAERIARHQKMIEFFQEDIAWLKESNYTGGQEMPQQLGEKTTQYIQQQEKNIEMYEGFIAKLKEQV